ncbi:hypothetical protein AO368_0625 [Moraxella catarrhalis]|nr:hypothetical protein AO380_1800 [Moraxella catarrhalis]OAV05303.1 hypothetical protein AO379_1690 [Moraxella catarrhalis]OAV09746.1 hypothetical protein AO378_0864 [Moraxella catarrhalis]OAV14461.1 hypothetical protein AO376_1051 [Moraxella catarrhalis]OAV16248.1 hypothetical protein AO374_1735 [Moraxella catarrhalis]
MRRAKIKYEIVRHDKFRYFMINGRPISALSYLKLLNFGMILVEKLNEKS